MKLDFINVEKFAKHLYDKDIDANQFIICYMLYKKDIKLIEEFKGKFNLTGIHKHASIDEVIRNYIDDLVDKGYIENFNPISGGKRHYKINNFLVTNKFTMAVQADRQKLAKELWDAYPMKILIKDLKSGKSREIHAKTVAFDELPDIYGDAIEDDVTLHDKIVKRLIAYKRKNQYIDIGLQKFIDRRYWENLSDEDISGDDMDQFNGDDMIKKV